MQLTPGLKSSELWLNVASSVGAVVVQALATNPNPAISLSVIALSALYTLVRSYLKSRQLDAVAAADALAKLQAAAHAVVVPAPEPLPPFGGMTASEKAAAHEVPAPAKP